MLFAENNGKDMVETKVVTRFSMKFWTSGLWTRPIRVPHRSSSLHSQKQTSVSGFAWNRRGNEKIVKSQEDEHDSNDLTDLSNSVYIRHLSGNGQTMKFMEEVDDIRKKKVSAELEYRNSMPASSFQQQKLRVFEIW